MTVTLYYMARSALEARRKAKSENPNFVITKVTVKAYWGDKQKEYKVELRPKKRTKPRPPAKSKKPKKRRRKK